MRLLNNPFRLILPLLFLFTAFSVDAQFKSKVVLTTGDPTSDCDGVAFDGGYTFEVDLTLWNLNTTWAESTDATTGETTWILAYESPCDMHMGVTVENYDSQGGTAQTLFLQHFFELDFDVSTGSTNTLEIFIPRKEIEEMFCSEESEDLYFTFQLFCLEDEIYTEINPCDEEFESFFDLEEGECDLSVTVEVPLCCQEDLIDFVLIDQNAKSELLAVDRKFNSLELNNISESGINYQIITISGKLVIQGRLTNNEAIERIDISYLEHGLYVLTYSNSQKMESIKFIK